MNHNTDILFIFARNTRYMQPQVIIVTGALLGLERYRPQMLSAQGHIVYGQVKTFRNMNAGEDAG